MTEDPLENPVYERRVTDILNGPFATKRLAAELEEKDRLSDLAYFDRLTKIPNGDGLIKKGDELIEALWAIKEELETSPGDEEYAQPPIVLVFTVDLVGLKRTNDNDGRAAGNRKIKGVGEALQKTFQRSPDLYGRVSGDEFLVFAFNTPHSGADALHRKLIAHLEEGTEVYVVAQQVAIGRETKMETLFNLAESNLDEVKVGLDTTDFDETGRLLRGGFRKLENVSL